jgi:hypothetical protein
MPQDHAAHDEIRYCPPAEEAGRGYVADSPTPILAWLPSLAPSFARFVWLILLAGCVMLIVMGLHLKPDPRGHSTHEQLHLPPCGFYLYTGYPCPTCGATTAFTWVVHGHPWMGLKTQPFGAIAAFVAVALLGMSLVGIVTAGVPVVRLTRRLSFGLALAIMTLLLGSWLYKIVMTLAAR